MPSLGGPLPSPRPTVVSIELPDGAVIFCPETEVYYGTNKVGAVVWELLATPQLTLDELCTAIGERFPDAQPGQVRADVIELLHELDGAGLTNGATETPTA